MLRRRHNLVLSTACAALLIRVAIALGEPRIASDGHGHLLTIWGSSFIEVAGSHDGVTWTPPGGPAARGSHSQLAAGGAGAWVALWDAPSDNDIDVLASRSIDDGATWTDPVSLDSITKANGPYDFSGGMPDVATDGHGTWLAVWSAGSGVVGAVSVDQGLTWANRFRVDAGVGSVLGPHVATDGRGVWVVVFESALVGPGFATVEWLATRSLGIASWTTPVVLRDADGAQFNEPHVAANASGDWLVAWKVGGAETHVEVARSIDRGVTWSAPTVVDDTAPPHRVWDEPFVMADGDAWSIVWSAALLPLPAPGSLQQYAIVWIATSSDGLAWTVRSNGPAMTEPSMVPDGAGGLVLVGDVTRFGSLEPPFLGSYPIGPDVVASRSANGGTTWSPPVRLNVFDLSGCGKPADCDDRDTCTTETCRPSDVAANADGCVSTRHDDGCVDGDPCTRDVCNAGACSRIPRAGFAPRCTFQPELVAECAEVHSPRVVRRWVQAGRRLAARATRARNHGRRRKAARLAARAAGRLTRALDRMVRDGAQDPARAACVTALGLALGPAIAETGGSVVVAHNAKRIELPDGILTLALSPGDYLLFATCTISNQRSIDNEAFCGFDATPVKSPSIAVPSLRGTTITMFGRTHVAAATVLAERCGQGNDYQLASLIFADQCTAVAVPTEGAGIIPRSATRR